MRPSLVRLCAPILLGAISTGCSEYVQFDFYNNTPGAVSIVGCGTPVVVASRSVMEIDSIACGAQIELKDADGSRNYRDPLPDHGVYSSGALYFHRGGSFLRRTARVFLQINADHRLWVLPDGMAFPVQGEISQPSGFPLSPR